MSPDRSLKRPSDSGDDSPTGSKHKIARLDRGPEDFSSVVKNKLLSYTRTGQACDRCKVRKIRCDALPEGCSHCANQNLECYVTDRVTGRTERRGYMQELEREKNGMMNRIRELEQLLETHGVEVRPFDETSGGEPYTPGMPPQSPNDEPFRRGSNKTKGSATSYRPYSVLESRPSKSYLGVTSDNSPLSSIKGTTLSILGMTLDITSFDAPDMDEPPPGAPFGSPLYNKSVMAYLQSSLNINPPLDNVDLPSRQDAVTYSEWYFLMIHPFLPVMHKPSFMNLLARMYDDPSFKPTVPELVTVHMVFATIYFQYGVRNREDAAKQAQLHDLSIKHYHWSLSKTFDLLASQTVTAVQALAMIATYTRSFPKPGCSSMVANYALCKAIELNLHRAVKLPGGGTNIENEVRKRVWWITLGISVTLNGRLGRPMPIGPEDFDVEFPMAIPDEYLSDEGIVDQSKIGQCNYMVGLVGFKVVPLYMAMYSNIYSVRRDPSKYMEVVRDLEQSMRAIQDGLPDELKLEKCKPGTEMFALYTQAFCLEFELCLRHPSVCMTDDSKFCAENTRICEETARKMLKVVGKLLKMKCLDTTWYQLSVYVAAIFSTLATHWERRMDTTPFEIVTLREEMKTWIAVVYEICILLGSGSRIGDEITVLIERTIGWIEQDSHRKNSSPTSQQPLAQSQIKQQPQPSFHQNGHRRAKSSPTANDHISPPSGRNSVPSATGNGYFDAGLAVSAAGFPSTLAYADQTGGSNGMGNGSGTYDHNDGGVPQYMYAASGAATGASVAVVDMAPSHDNPLIAFASQAAAHVGTAGGGGGGGHQHQHQHQHQHHPATGLAMATGGGGGGGAGSAPDGAAGHGSTWHDWTTAIADHHADRYSASALMNLGTGRDVVGGGLGVDGSTGQWPLLLFPDGSGTVSGA